MRRTLVSVSQSPPDAIIFFSLLAGLELDGKPGTGIEPELDPSEFGMRRVRSAPGESMVRMISSCGRGTGERSGESIVQLSAISISRFVKRAVACPVSGEGGQSVYDDQAGQSNVQAAVN